MKIKMNTLLIWVFLLLSSSSFGQDVNSEIWTEIESAQYLKLNELANYVHKKEKSEISKDTLFEKYIYFDYVLNEIDIERKEKRLAQFDTIFYYFRKTVDSLGINNLNAKPVRFYKGHDIYKPFDSENAKLSVAGEKMYSKDSNVFAYYKKEDPENPLGTLLFDPETDKLVAWIMLNQGGYRYFLTFNLF